MAEPPNSIKKDENTERAIRKGRLTRGSHAPTKPASSSTSKLSSASVSKTDNSEATARVKRLKTKVAKLQNALFETSTALSVAHKADRKSSDLSIEDLRARRMKIQVVLADAKTQLSSATQALGQLAHSAITSEPNADANFARFRSAERIRQNDSGF